MTDWNASEPIYLQLRNLLVRQIMSGHLPEGDAIPSVRQVAADERINPVTVSKAYQLLVEQGLVEKRRGLGMFVTAGAQRQAIDNERAHFLREEWPELQARIRELGLDAHSLLRALPDKDGDGGNP